MWSDLFPTETDRALDDMAAHPRPPKPREPSVWAKAGTLLASPYTGAAQGINESLRVANRVLGALPSAPSVRERNAEIFGAIDETLRSGAEYWAPDPQTSTFASEFLHGGARVLTKVAGYNAIGGPAGALVGTSLDEAGTQYLTMRDKGVDPGTAAAAGAARGAATAVGFAIPVAGSTIGRTAALAGIGALTTVAETALTREILARANYADLAAQFDPWDPALLGAAIIPGAAFGIAAHASRARRAKAAAQAQPQPDPLQAVAEEPGMVEAAHVALQRQVADANMLADAADPQARVTHQRAMDEARRALDAGEPMRLGDVVVDEARVRAAAERLAAAGEPVRAADVASVAAPRVALTETPEFRAWFGDSKVVNSDGLPMVVYHGTGADIAAFDPARSRDAGVWMTPVPGAAEMYSGARDGANLIPIYASLRNPYEARVGESRADALFRAADGGHDGVIVRETDGSISTLAAFRPEQIKSAIGNSGRFDPTSGSLIDSSYSTWADHINAAIREMQDQARRTDAPTTPQAETPDAAAPARGAGELPVATPAQRADRIAVERPDMPVRMDENAPSQPVRDVLTVERQLQRDVADEVDRAHQAAIECFLKFGD